MRDYINVAIELMIYAAGVILITAGLISIICWGIIAIIKAIKGVMKNTRKKH